MAEKIILPLADPNATLETVGGKGASLAQLSAAGLPVPGGFHVTTEAYRQFVAANDLQPRIRAALQEVDPSSPHLLERAAQAIHCSFDRSAIPEDIAHAMNAAYTALPGTNPVVAVRSSATAEDLPTASFAGQQETYLNISGPEAVLAAIKNCWASLWTARAIGYRARHGIGAEGVSLAVVVQLLVPAEAAGILFTVNPLNGRRDQIVINASWGLGEAVVGGQVTPDTLVLDRETCHILERQVAEKQVMTVQVAGGTSEQPVPENRRGVPVLDDERAADLARLGVRIGQLYGMPMDIEWAWANGKFYILQARPITALPEPAALAPVEWPLPNPKGQYMRASVVDLMPNPLSPLFASMGIPGIVEGFRRTWRALDHSEPVLPSDYFTTINSYAYGGVKFTARQWWWMLSRMLPAFPRLLRTAVPFWRNEVHPNYQAAIARWEGLRLDELSAAELWNGVSEILGAALHYVGTLMIATTGAAAGSEGLLTMLYKSFSRREGDPPATTLVMGYNSIPVQAEKSLYDLALWCGEHPVLSAYLQATPSEKLAVQIVDGSQPGDVNTGEWQELQLRFAQHLKRFGHIIYELDFGKPLPLDDPTPMLEMIKVYLHGEGVNPYQRQSASEEKRKQASQMMLDRLKGLRRWAFRKALNWAQSLAEVREDALADIGLGYPLLRQMLKELGRRFAQAGAIRQAQDIFWLEKAEVEAGVAGLESGLKLSDLAATVEQRKRFCEQMKGITPPSMLPPRKRYLGFKVDAFVAATDSDQVGNTLKGIGASAGTITAPACVLHGPEDFDQMKPGAVLVAAITTPAWTPLFAMASGVVTDIGGPLSHGSIVAREYGIPAVMGTGVATHRIHSGQVVTVDGTAGIVTL